MALDKPAGWHSVAQRRSADEPSVEGWLRLHHPPQASLPEAGLVHRLDRGTSGILVAAVDAMTHARLRESFGADAAGGPAKTYLALVAPGIASEGAFALYFTSRYKGSAKVTVQPRGAAGHLGRCRWRVLRRGGPADLVEVALEGPGRRHQIRAGLAHLGHPLLGDVLYDGPPRAGGAALHAWRLTLDGVQLESRPPADFTPGPTS